MIAIARLALPLALAILGSSCGTIAGGPFVQAQPAFGMIPAPAADPQFEQTMEQQNDPAALRQAIAGNEEATQQLRDLAVNYPPGTLDRHIAGAEQRTAIMRRRLAVLEGGAAPAGGGAHPGEAGAAGAPPSPGPGAGSEGPPSGGGAAFCTGCGTQYKEGVRFCTRCGAPRR